MQSMMDVEHGMNVFGNLDRFISIIPPSAAQCSGHSTFLAKRIAEHKSVGPPLPSIAAHHR